MTILLLTQYFPPETGAPQNRLYDLAQKLRQRGDKVIILTGFPNYPKYEVFKGYKGKRYMQEEIDGLPVHRSYIYVSKNKSILNRLLNYFSFTFSALLIGWWKVEKVDLIICESPPLFLGWTAVILKYLKKSQLIFNVSDLWPESAVRLGIVNNAFLIQISTWLEEWIYKKSDKISGQTQGILANIRQRFPNKPYFWLRNGVDYKELQSRLSGRNWRFENGFTNEDLLFYFGGLIGYAQGLDCVIKAGAKLKEYPEVKFIIVGEGPEKDRLIKLKEELDANNVHFIPGVPKSEVADVIASMDVGVVPLKKLDLFWGAIPSKIFEILCLGKPILLGIKGEAKEIFIDQAQAGIAFEPEDDVDLIKKIRQFLDNQSLIKILGENGKRFVVENFDRHAITSDFQKFLQDG